MQQQQLAREQDTFEVVAFLRAENDTLQERLKHFEGKENEKQRVLPQRIAVCVGGNSDAAALAGQCGSR